MVGQSTFLFIQNQNGSYNGGTRVNSLSCFVYGHCATGSYQQGFRFHTLLWGPFCLNSAVVQCDPFTPFDVTTDTNKSHILTSEPLLRLFCQSTFSCLLPLSSHPFYFWNAMSSGKAEPWVRAHPHSSVFLMAFCLLQSIVVGTQ